MNPQAVRETSVEVRELLRPHRARTYALWPSQNLPTCRSSPVPEPEFHPIPSTYTPTLPHWPPAALGAGSERRPRIGRLQ
jgi:hypothetical protein